MGCLQYVSWLQPDEGWEFHRGPGLPIELSKLLRETKIIGVDPSEQMIDLARRNAAQAGLKNFEAKVGSTENLPIESECIDLVIAQALCWKSKGTLLANLNILT